MNSNRGFFTTQILLYIAAGMGVALFLSWGALWVQTQRLEASEGRIASMVAAARAQEEANRKKAEADAKLAKEKDRDAKRRIAAADARAKRLLDGAGRNVLPPADPAGSPDLACFDRPLLAGALDRFLRDATAIALDGDKAAIGLDTAKSWAQELLRR